MREWACLQSLSGTPNIRSSALFLLHHRDGSPRDTLPVPPVFLFAEACPAKPFVPRCHRERFRERSATRHRLCDTERSSGTTLPVRDKNPIPLGRAFLP